MDFVPKGLLYYNVVQIVYTALVIVCPVICENCWQHMVTFPAFSKWRETITANDAFFRLHDRREQRRQHLVISSSIFSFSFASLQLCLSRKGLLKAGAAYVVESRSATTAMVVRGSMIGAQESGSH